MSIEPVILFHAKPCHLTDIRVIFFVYDNLHKSMKCEIVVFSPARRASRKLLERMVEFIRLLGHEPIEASRKAMTS